MRARTRVPAHLLVHLRRARDLADRCYAEPLDLDQLTAKGVEFVQPPSERPYGVEAILRDVAGNWLVLVERREYTGGDFPH